MGNGKKCTCGHVLTDHKARYRNKVVTRLKCEWYDCECKLFVHDGKIHTYGRKPALTEPISPLVNEHRRQDYIGELRSDGTIIRR